MFGYGSIRRKIITLFLISAIPAITFLVFDGLWHRNETIAQSQQELLDFISLLAERQEKTTLKTQYLLDALSKKSAVQRFDVQACRHLFNAELKNHPQLAGIHLVDLKGNLIVSDTPRTFGNFSKTKHFRDAVTTKAFAPGEQITGLLRPIQIFPFAHPVLDQAGDVQGVLVTAMLLDRYGQQFAESEFPENSFVGACDHNGIRLYRSPKISAGAIGQPIRKSMFETAKGRDLKGFKYDIGSDGVERIIAFCQIRLDSDKPPYMYVFVGIPSATVHAKANNSMIWQVALFCLLAILTVSIGWFFGGRNLGRRLEELAHFSSLVGQGDLSVRVKPDSNIKELTTLAQSFNAMVESLTQEITERKKNEDAFRLEALRRRILMNCSYDGIAIIDQDHRVQEANKRFAQMLGYSHAEIVGLQTWEYEANKTEDQIRSFFSDLSCINMVFESVHRRKDSSTYPVEVSASGAEIEGKQMVFVICRDISERKKFEEDLLVAKEKADAASNAKSEFLANMSHEIRTPLNGLLGMLQLIQTTELKHEQREYVLNAILSSKRLTRLLSDILDFSRIEAGKLEINLEAFDLAKIVQQVFELFNPLAMQSGLEFSCDIDPAIPRQVIGDPARLQQILTNLVGNALKFTKHGSVTLSAALLPAKTQTKQWVLLSVSDTGIGIQDDILKGLFKPFTQASAGFAKNHQGAGLGLSICKRLLDLMGGSISVESSADAKDSGTTFYVSIPFELFDSLPSGQQPVFGPQETFRVGLKILLAEDDKVNQFAAQGLLEKLGNSVVSVENGSQVLDAIRRESFDLVLMDVQMPDMDGIEATQAIRNGKAGAANKDLPIIALTAYAMGGDREKFLSMGMNDYIAKPVDMTTLVNIIKRVFSR